VTLCSLELRGRTTRFYGSKLLLSFSGRAIGQTTALPPDPPIALRRNPPDSQERRSHLSKLWGFRASRLRRFLLRDDREDPRDVGEDVRPTAGLGIACFSQVHRSLFDMLDATPQLNQTIEDVLEVVAVIDRSGLTKLDSQQEGLRDPIAPSRDSSSTTWTAGLATCHR
jgi:hypothetical protein